MSTGVYSEKASGHRNIFSSLDGVAATKSGTTCLLDMRLHMFALGLNLTGKPWPFVFHSSSTMIFFISRSMSANESYGVYAILCSIQYCSSLNFLLAKRTSASRAAGRSETPSPMKTIRGTVSSSDSILAACRYSLMESALS